MIPNKYTDNKVFNLELGRSKFIITACITLVYLRNIQIYNDHISIIPTTIDDKVEQIKRFKSNMTENDITYLHNITLNIIIIQNANKFTFSLTFF